MFEESLEKIWMRILKELLSEYKERKRLKVNSVQNRSGLALLCVVLPSTTKPLHLTHRYSNLIHLQLFYNKGVDPGLFMIQKMEGAAMMIYSSE